MFVYLAENDFTATIECTPAPGTEPIMLDLVLTRARENGVCIHVTFQHGWMVFHAHRTGSTADVPLPREARSLLPRTA